MKCELKECEHLKSFAMSRLDIYRFNLKALSGRLNRLGVCTRYRYGGSRLWFVLMLQRPMTFLCWANTEKIFGVYALQSFETFWELLDCIWSAKDTKWSSVNIFSRFRSRWRQWNKRKWCTTSSLVSKTGQISDWHQTWKHSENHQICTKFINLQGLQNSH